ncbi:Potassium-transporting ATPase KdpF subunit [Candidatus Hydrogenisulfobacillus filiaventi]|uniref:Potassium-transporting ATPase KdpF subunit n=1 Tax=Candidatus Hydrogenisulfobacillus filiaventi TaxID=2707344 RepID=A0A6F8ZCE7_9FIRM|nr:K(+)-transporting ATPase subunit F [Bacillota bacterium]CAB1127601.1 Potassium-transporting ATPase KdpF subunit [Candidatus Hydrogenisulfobacillus filiaventi]
MSLGDAALLFVSVLVMVYLLYVILRPDRF